MNIWNQTSGMMWGRDGMMVVIGLLILVVLLLGAVALAKYIFGSR